MQNSIAHELVLLATASPWYALLFEDRQRKQMHNSISHELVLHTQESSHRDLDLETPSWTGVQQLE